MKKYDVLLSKSAIKSLYSLTQTNQDRIKKCLIELSNNPFNSRAKVDIKKLHKMSKHQLYRLRVGNYRIVYFIEDDKIKITAVFSREKGYSWLD